MNTPRRKPWTTECCRTRKECDSIPKSSLWKLHQACADAALGIPTRQLICVAVRIENLCVIQLSKTRQVAVNSSSLSNSHIGKQYGVRVRDAVIVYRSRPAACRFVCGGDHSLSHQYSSFVGAHGCEACAKLSDRYRQYPLDKRRKSIHGDEYNTLNTATKPVENTKVPLQPIG